jgi:hypothetical protein
MQFEASATNEDVNSSDGGNADDKIEVPANCVKRDQSVNIEEDAWSLLHSLRYWIVGTELPSSLVTFCLSPNGKELSASFWQSFEYNFTHLDALRKMATSNAKEPSAKVRMAIATGDAYLVQIVHEILQCKLSSTACLVAALSGSLACLQYVHENSATNTDRNVSRALIAAGSLECLKFAVKHGYVIPPDACTLAVRHGQPLCLQYLLTLPDMRWNNDICCIAAREGQLDCLRVAVEEGSLELTPPCTYAAVRSGQLACLKYMHKQGAQWNVLRSMH